MNEIDLIPCKLDKMPEGKLTNMNNVKVCDIGTKTASTVTARYMKGIGAHKDNMCIEIKKVGQISNDGSQYGTVISDDGLCSTLTAGTHGYANNCISVKQATKEGSIKCKVGGCYDASYPDSKTRRGRVQDNGDTVPTLTASSSENINYVETVYRIRKLTPKECFRLMSFRDEDYEAASKVNSNTQLYKQAGNSICECVLKAIFSQMGIKGVPKWNDTH